MKIEFLLLLLFLSSCLNGQCICPNLISGNPCNSIYEPVCGCNNEEYSNWCNAQEAGVSSWKMGECGNTSGDWIFATCPNGNTIDNNCDCGGSSGSLERENCELPSLSQACLIWNNSEWYDCNNTLTTRNPFSESTRKIVYEGSISEPHVVDVYTSLNKPEINNNGQITIAPIDQNVFTLPGAVYQTVQVRNVDSRFRIIFTRQQNFPNPSSPLIDRSNWENGNGSGSQYLYSWLDSFTTDFGGGINRVLFQIEYDNGVIIDLAEIYYEVKGTEIDSDYDGIPDSLDCSPSDCSINLVVGSSCDDGNATTFNDMIQPDCICRGTSSDNNVNLRFSNVNAMDCGIVCVPLRADNFANIRSFQGTVRWDSDVVSYKNTQEYALPGMSENSFFNIADGILTFVWTENPAQTPVTFVDGTTLYEVCFEILGSNGESTAVVLSDSPTSLELGDENLEIVSFTTSPGSVTINMSGDADGDGVCNVLDQCPNFDDNLIGTDCDDGNPATSDDMYQADCECRGILNCIVGSNCDDGDECTTDDIFDANCECKGADSGDTDGDGVCDASDQCPGFDDNNIGQSCDDGIDCSEGATWDQDCDCTGGVIQDMDSDGVCDDEDICPNFDDNLVGTSCDDGDNFTSGDTYTSACICEGFCNHPDYSALILFYDSTNGLSWSIPQSTQSFAWDENCDPCSWYGVMCDSDRRIVGFDLDGKVDGQVSDISDGIGMSGFIPQLNFPDMEYLILKNNKLTGNTPDLRDMPNLKLLDVSNNQLEGSIADFPDNSKLEIFNVRANNLAGIIPDIFGQVQLVHFNVGRNNLSGDIPQIDELSMLRSFEIYNNDITGDLPDFSALTQLEYMNIDSNSISGVMPDLQQLSNLSVLSARSNNIEGSFPDISLLPELNLIDLSGNKLTGPVDTINNVPKLRYLIASENNLSGSLPRITEVPLLSTIDLRDNAFDGELPEEWGELPLDLLFLSNNDLLGCIPESWKNLCTMTEEEYSSVYAFGDCTGSLQGCQYDIRNNDRLPWSGDYGAFCRGLPQDKSPCLIDGADGVIDECICIPDSCYLIARDDVFEIKQLDSLNLDILINDKRPKELSVEFLDITDDVNVLYDNEKVGGSLPTDFVDDIIIRYEIISEACGKRDTATITLKNKALVDLTLTNVISPDGNGSNDVLRFSDDPEVIGSKLTIFNRWGDVVYKKENYTNDWSADDISGGIYFYVLEVNGATVKKTLTILK